MSVAIPGEPVATAPAEYDGFSLDVYALHRESDKSVFLVFGVRNGSDEDRTFQREMEDPAVDGPVDYAISGISLFDAVNLKRHLVFLDERRVAASAASPPRRPWRRARPSTSPPSSRLRPPTSRR